MAKTAKKGRRVAIAVTAGAVMLSSTGYTRAAGIEDVFDEHYYADMYPDLKAAYGYNRAALLKHFMRYGFNEGRTMNGMIDIVKYREKYPDLQEAFGDDWDAYVDHYLNYGAFEHRDSGTGFDPVDYLERYGDLKDAFGDDMLAAYRHYMEYGKEEGREARSEAVVRAEGGWTMAWGGDDDEEEPSEPVPTEEPVKPTEEPVPTEEPAKPTAEPVPTEKPAEPTAEPVPTEEPAGPTAEPAPTEEPVPTEEPAPTEGPVPTEEPAPTEGPIEPTAEPVPTAEPAPTGEPIGPTEEPAPTEEPSKPTQEPIKPTETPAPTATPMPTQEPVPTEEPSTPEPVKFMIQSVEVTGKGHIRVTLNQKTQQPLAKEAFSIICNSGGSDMTILSVSTEDNMVYNLSTSYYRDQEYDIEITLPDGTRISRVFEYRTDCAEISSINAVRTGATEAAVTYISNEPGTFYYLLRENGQSLARAASSLMEVAETAEAAEPTEAEIINNGIRTEMEQHENAITVTGLKEGMSYTVYYVAVNTEEKSTLVNSFSIDGKVHEETAEAIKGAKAFAEKLNVNEYLYGFEIELEAATSETLTLEQFNISCPLNETELGEVRTSDNKTYHIYMKRGTIPKGNNTYTILINMKDGTQLKGTCYLDLEAPQVSIWDFEWIDETTVKVMVNSNEAGYLYYAIQDTVEGEGTVEGKDPSQIYAGGTKVKMGYGLNYITVQGIREGQWFCCASEDNRENREDFYTYKRIPAYTAPDPDQAEWPQISSVTVTGDKTFKVVFDKSTNDVYYENMETQISGLGGKPLFSATWGSEGGLENNVLNFTLKNLTIPEGECTLTIVLYGFDEEGYVDETKRKFLTYNFTR